MEKMTQPDQWHQAPLSPRSLTKLYGVGYKVLKDLSGHTPLDPGVAKPRWKAQQGIRDPEDPRGIDRDPPPTATVQDADMEGMKVEIREMILRVGDEAFNVPFRFYYPQEVGPSTPLVIWLPSTCLGPMSREVPLRLLQSGLPAMWADPIMDDTRLLKGIGDGKRSPAYKLRPPCWASLGVPCGVGRC
eukprot:5569601-Amphidinium_carterae.1